MSRPVEDLDEPERPEKRPEALVPPRELDPVVLGHSSVTVTLDRYGHLYDGLDAQVAGSLDDVLRTSRGLTAASSPAPGASLRLF